MSWSKELKRKANTNNASLFKSPGKIAAISISFLTVVIAAIATIVIISGKSTTVVKNSDLIIQKSEITENAKFYPVEVDGTKLEVLAVKASDNTIRTAFNTCQICYSSGRGYYVQEGSFLVCQNCGNRFSMDEVEVARGGCNPVPITADEKTETETSIIISKDFLNIAKGIFSNWKK
ncbi:MAG TPA: DUF2318 domain-containing protein [Clostridiales bacterium]|nr:DUF2318 domain-containing protein [Clostridiales bacterium]